MTADDYNDKVNRAIESLNAALPTFAIRDEGRTIDEHSCILIEKGRFYGMGYISHYFRADDIQQLKTHLTPYPGNDYIRNIVSGYAARFPERKLVFAGA
jgi:DNA polymerase III subunit epsilon